MELLFHSATAYNIYIIGNKKVSATGANQNEVATLFIVEDLNEEG
jgi:hypothetical protein